MEEINQAQNENDIFINANGYYSFPPDLLTELVYCVQTNHLNVGDLGVLQNLHKHLSQKWTGLNKFTLGELKCLFEEVKDNPDITQSLTQWVSRLPKYRKGKEKHINLRRIFHKENKVYQQASSSSSQPSNSEGNLQQGFTTLLKRPLDVNSMANFSSINKRRNDAESSSQSTPTGKFCDLRVLFGPQYKQTFTSQDGKAMLFYLHNTDESNPVLELEIQTLTYKIQECGGLVTTSIKDALKERVHFIKVGNNLTGILEFDKVFKMNLYRKELIDDSVENKKFPENLADYACSIHSTPKNLVTPCIVSAPVANDQEGRKDFKSYQPGKHTKIAVTKQSKQMINADANVENDTIDATFNDRLIQLSPENIHLIHNQQCPEQHNTILRIEASDDIDQIDQQQGKRVEILMSPERKQGNAMPSPTSDLQKLIENDSSDDEIHTEAVIKESNNSPKLAMSSTIIGIPMTPNELQSSFTTDNSCPIDEPNPLHDFFANTTYPISSDDKLGKHVHKYLKVLAILINHNEDNVSRSCIDAIEFLKSNFNQDLKLDNMRKFYSSIVKPQFVNWQAALKEFTNQKIISEWKNRTNKKTAQELENP